MDVLERFCDAEFSAKTKPYHCCKLAGEAQQHCFKDAAPLPKQDPRGVERDAPPKLPELAFPPGRPSSANIRNICTLRKFRPARASPQSGFGWYQRQAQTLTRLEKGFKKCCRTQDVGCARRAVSGPRRGMPCCARVAPRFPRSAASRGLRAPCDGEPASSPESIQRAAPPEESRFHTPAWILLSGRSFAPRRTPTFPSPGRRCRSRTLLCRWEALGRSKEMTSAPRSLQGRVLSARGTALGELGAGGSQFD